MGSIETLLRQHGKNMRFKKAASAAAIGRLERQVALPADFKEFLLFSDGASGVVGVSHLVLFGVKEMLNIREMSRDYGLEPRHFVFGANGSLADYAFDPESTPPHQVVLVDKIDPDIVELVAATFGALVQKLADAPAPPSKIQYSPAEAADFLKRSRELYSKKKK